MMNTQFESVNTKFEPERIVILGGTSGIGLATAELSQDVPERMRASLEVVTNYDYIQINASSKPESFLTMLETLASAVSNPTIDKAMASA